MLLPLLHLTPLRCCCCCSCSCCRCCCWGMQPACATAAGQSLTAARSLPTAPHLRPWPCPHSAAPLPCRADIFPALAGILIGHTYYFLSGAPPRSLSFAATGGCVGLHGSEAAMLVLARATLVPLPAASPRSCRRVPSGQRAQAHLRASGLATLAHWRRWRTGRCSAAHNAPLPLSFSCQTSTLAPAAAF